MLWVLRSTLEKFGFQVVRVDEIARSTTITNEIVQLIQQSELCVIVLTGENPNVFYEAGRRHETGKPFIQLCRRTDRIPFDVAGIRTILYDDIQSLSAAVKLTDEIEKYVAEFEKGGYGASGTGVSLSTIAGAVDRLEQKIGRLFTAAPAASMVSATGMPLDHEIMRNPREAFMAAFAQGDAQRASAILPRIEQLHGPSLMLLASAGALSSQGDERAFEIVFRLMTEVFEKLRQEDPSHFVTVGIASLVQFYVVTDREQEGIARLRPVFEKCLGLQDLSPADRAFVLNQMQMLMYGSKKYEEALKLCEEAMKLAPDEVAYVYNASLIYDKLKLPAKASEMVDRYMKSAECNAPHYAHAVTIYLAQERTRDAQAAFLRLRQLDAGKAAVLLLDSDIKRRLQL